MKQQDIARHIGELLYYHDCVILPNLGGFIANYSSARIDIHRKLIHPPSKRILFNKHVKVNDGLLASKIVKEESISFEKANKALNSFIHSVQRKINAGERVAFEKIGVLYLNKENNIQFTQDATNFLTSSYGLPSVDLIPVEEKVESKVIEDKKEPKIIPIVPVGNNESNEIPKKKQATVQSSAEDSTPEKEKEEKRKSSAVLWAAAILLPIFLLYSIFVGYNGYQDGNGFNTASFNPFNWFYHQDSVFDIDSIPQVQYSSEIQEKSHPIEVTEIEPTINNDTVFEHTTIQVDTVDTEEQADHLEAVAESTFVETEKKPAKINFRYHLIGGCFGKEKYASEFIDEMKEEGFAAQELDLSKGLHRISLGGTNSRKEARRLRKKAKDKGISCWILRQ